MEGGFIPGAVEETTISANQEELRAAASLGDDENQQSVKAAKASSSAKVRPQQVELLRVSSEGHADSNENETKKPAVVAKLPIFKLWKYANKAERIMIG